jgi:hypothetical protein
MAVDVRFGSKADIALRPPHAASGEANRIGSLCCRLKPFRIGAIVGHDSRRDIPGPTVSNQLGDELAYHVARIWRFSQTRPCHF